ncbi:hypothetical protein IU487_22365 [Nocardia puris]|uniref:hypothetical protein n=1 Tax=Nocardia puris TaxID=208602 RepID=UPI0018959CED|nr:hypothetical protein [Nocardia puris]MBF6213765.1 hypothetical protein [Nocardia puris]
MPPRAPKLRAVGEDELPPERKSITEAAADGDHLAMLQALRTRIAQQVESPNCPSRDLAALSRRLIEIAKEIEAIELAEGEDRSVVANTDDEDWDESAI